MRRIRGRTLEKHGFHAFSGLAQIRAVHVGIFGSVYSERCDAGYNWRVVCLRVEFLAKVVDGGALT